MDWDRLEVEGVFVYHYKYSVKNILDQETSSSQISHLLFAAFQLQFQTLYRLPVLKTISNKELSPHKKQLKQRLWNPTCPAEAVSRAQQ